MPGTDTDYALWIGIGSVSSVASVFRYLRYFGLLRFDSVLCAVLTDLNKFRDLHKLSDNQLRQTFWRGPSSVTHTNKHTDTPTHTHTYTLSYTDTPAASDNNSPQSYKVSYFRLTISGSGLC